MKQHPRALTSRLRAVWSPRTPREAAAPTADAPPAEAFAARLRAAVEAHRH